MAEVYTRVRRAYNPQPGDVEELLRSLPRDINGNMSFADVQKVVMDDHSHRVARSRQQFPDLDPRTRKKVIKPLPVGVQETTAQHVTIKKDEEALLSQYVYQMAEAEETKYPGLRQNIHLTRPQMTSMDTVLSSSRRWDSECCVRLKDTQWVKPTKIVM